MKEEMMNMIIRKFGFEAKDTIWFCTLCEKNLPEDIIVGAYESLLKDF